MRLSIITLLSLGASLCWGQDVIVTGNSTQPAVLKSTNTSTAAVDRPGIYGVSKPAGGYGIGVRGDGSSVGVYGLGTLSGTGSRFGVYGISSGGASGNFGVYGIATGGTQAFGGYFSAGGGTQNFAGYFSGNVYVTGTVTQASDEELKTNIHSLDSTMLDKVLSLNPKIYNMKADKYPGMNFSNGIQYGLMAQDVQNVFPDLVSEAPAPADNPSLDGSKTTPSTKNFKSVNYTGLIPVLIKAMQQQQDQINQLKNQVGKLKAGGNNGNDK